MALYTLLPTGGVRLNAAPPVFIPADPANGQWSDYLKWVALGNEADPIEPQPTPIREITAYAFMMRFTAPERSAIRAATAVNDDLADLYDRQRAAQTINLDDAEVIGGLAMLEGAGILAEGRAAEILA